MFISYVIEFNLNYKKTMVTLYLTMHIRVQTTSTLKLLCANLGSLSFNFETLRYCDKVIEGST